MAMFLSFNSFATDDLDYVAKKQLCYAKSTIGFDFVINSRLGIYPEVGVQLTGYGSKRAEFFLESILGAYLWEDSPAEYAIFTFDNCIHNIDSITFLK